MTAIPITGRLPAPGAPAIPGLVFRRFRGAADYPAMAEVARRCAQADDIDEFPTAEELATFFDNATNLEPEHDVIVAEVDGEMAGYQWSDWRDEVGGLRVHRLSGYVAPAWRRRGIGRTLLALGERRHRQLAASHVTDRPRLFQSYTPATRVSKVALLEGAGYRPVRHNFEMLHTDLEHLPDAPLPAGLEIRPARPDHYRAIWEAKEEAFVDHWGNVRQTEADYQRWLESEEFSPALWQIAWDTARDEVAGIAIGTIPARANDLHGRQRGWVDELAVCRPYRKRGLGRALLVRSLALLRAAGMDEAMLGVDSENAYSALHLYESVGFCRHRHGIVFRKPLKLEEDHDG